MNNAQMFGQKGMDSFIKVFRAWCVRTNVNWPTTAKEVGYIRAALEFAASAAMPALDWNIGDIVQTKTGGRYAEVVGFCEMSFIPGEYDTRRERLLVKFAGKTESTVLSTDELKKPDFPPGLVELVKSQLRMNCPLKEAECECGK